MDMNLKYEDGAARVTLSRRNLEHLLWALDHVDGDEVFLHRMTDHGMLYVFAEEDARHYGDRQSGPGFTTFGKPDNKVVLGFES